MRPYSSEVLMRVNHSSTTGPAFRVTLDQELELRLIELRNELLAADPPLSPYTPPEGEGTRCGVQAEIIVGALLASEGRPVYVWQLWIAQAGYHLPPSAQEAFQTACERIAHVEGVEMISAQ